MISKELVKSKIDILEKHLMQIYDETFEREISNYEIANLRVEINTTLAKIDILEELLNEAQ